MNVEFNPEYVKEYRLIGFDNKAGALKDTASVLEGGEIGSGYSMVAAFEVTPSEINRGAIKDGFMGAKFANINLQYRYPKDTVNRHTSFSSQFNFTPIEKADRSYRFAASVIMFGSVLRSSPFTKKINWDNIIAMANGSYDTDNNSQKEFVSIVQKAKALYIKSKKKRGIFNFLRRE